MTHWINTSPDYTDTGISDFYRNPLIECLAQLPGNDSQAIDNLIRLPSFDKTELKLDKSKRLFMVERLRKLFVPTQQSLEIYRDTALNLFNGYKHRNPSTPDGQRYLLNAGITNNDSYGSIGEYYYQNEANITFITGLSGAGKSTLIRNIMNTFSKPVIFHSEYNGVSFHEKQIVYLMVNTPDQCSAKALCKTITSNADEMIQSDFYSKVIRSHFTREDTVKLLQRIIANNHIGVLIIDEFQNLSLSRSGGKNEIIALIINLREKLGIPIIIIGTYKAIDIIRNDASIARRLVEGGFYEIERPERADNDDWTDLCEIAWNYQWVTNPMDINNEIIETFYNCSQGIKAIMIRLFIRAQIEAITSGKEQVNAYLIKSIFNSKLFSPLHGMLEALKSKNKYLMNQFDDLYLKSFHLLEDNPMLHSQNPSFQEKQADKAKLMGIFDAQSKENVKDSKVELKQIKRTNEDLHKMIENNSSENKDVLDD